MIKYILKTNKIEQLMLVLTTVFSCLSLVLFRCQIVSTSLFQCFALISLCLFEIKPIEFLKDDEIFSHVSKLSTKLFLIGLPCMMTLIVPNLSSAFCFLLSVTIVAFVINIRGKFICAIITTGLAILLPITAYRKELLDFSLSFKIDFLQIILLSIPIISAIFSVLIARFKELNSSINNEGICIAILSITKFMVQVIVLPMFFERSYENFLTEGICLTIVSIFLLVKTLLISKYPSIKLISKIIREKYFSYVVDEFSLIIQPPLGMDLVNATLTIQGQQVRLYMFHNVEIDEELKLQKEGWRIEKSSYDNSRACVYESLLENDEYIIARNIISAIKKKEEPPIKITDNIFADEVDYFTNLNKPVILIGGAGLSRIKAIIEDNSDIKVYIERDQSLHLQSNGGRYSVKFHSFGYAIRDIDVKYSKGYENTGNSTCMFNIIARNIIDFLKKDD